MKPLPHRLGQTLLSLSVSLVCLSSAQAATNLSGRYVVETEDGWRLPTLGEDISYSVFYPSWFLGLGIGEARMREVDACDLRSIDLGNHFAPKWRWHINAAQCVLEDAPEQDFDTGSLRIEHLLGDVEATLNTYVGAGLTVVVEAAPVANLPSTNIASGENTATERLEDVVSTEPAEVVVAETIEPSVPVLVELPEPTDESTETEAISVVADAVASESAVTPDVNANAGADVTPGLPSTMCSRRCCRLSPQSPGALSPR